MQCPEYHITAEFLQKYINCVIKAIDNANPTEIIVFKVGYTIKSVVSLGNGIVLKIGPEGKSRSILMTLDMNMAWSESKMHDKDYLGLLINYNNKDKYIFFNRKPKIDVFCKADNLNVRSCLVSTLNDSDFIHLFKEHAGNNSIAALLNKSILYAGTGKYLVSEILHHLSINPKTKASDIKDNEVCLSKLNKMIVKICKLSLKSGGFDEFVHPDGGNGLFSTCVYGKEEFVDDVLGIKYKVENCKISAKLAVYYKTTSIDL